MVNSEIKVGVGNVEKNIVNRMIKYYANPFIKWAGGKRQIISELLKNIPKNFNNYFEPFLGGGALFFELYNNELLKNKQVYLSDINEQLINTYKIIQQFPYELIEELQKFEDKHCKEFYYEIRCMDRKSNFHELNDIIKAARFIYLNKTCFNGLYRVNKKGYFNVPIGNYKKPKILNKENILNVSKALQNVIILNIHYKKILKYIRKGDFIYFDPPYFPINNTSNFISYTKDSFLETEQLELFKFVQKLNNKQCFILESNSDTNFIKNLYNTFKIKEILANRTINSKITKRGRITELLIANY